MAGVKGRSGGPRPGAGRKPKVKAAGTAASTDSQVEKEIEVSAEVPGVEDQKPLEFLKSVYTNAAVPLNHRVRAAIAAAQYEHFKRGDGGKKDSDKEKAEKASGGKYSSLGAPRLASKNGKPL